MIIIFDVALLFNIHLFGFDFISVTTNTYKDK
nr:MAG TPA: hypothetical protein [Caudoviricetes sp.]